MKVKNFPVHSYNHLVRSLWQDEEWSYLKGISLDNPWVSFAEVSFKKPHLCCCRQWLFDHVLGIWYKEFSFESQQTKKNIFFRWYHLSLYLEDNPGSTVGFLWSNSDNKSIFNRYWLSGREIIASLYRVRR